MFRTGVLTACCALPFVFVSLPAGASAPPEVVVGEDSVVVVAEPGQDVWLMGFAERPLFGGARDEVFRKLLTMDEEGKAELPVEGGVPLRAVFAAIDPASGAFSHGFPDGFVGERLDSPLDLTPPFPGGLPTFLRLHKWYAIFLWVARPGEGVWENWVRQGSPRDHDEDYMVLSVSLEDASPLGDSGEPSRQFRPGDIVFGVDTLNLRFFLFEFYPGGVS